MRTSQRYKDNAKNAFAKTNLFYASGPFLGVQDPTVFGFKLFFHFNNMDSPLLFGINGDIQKAPTNTAAGFLKSIGDQQRLFYLEKFLYLLSGINTQCPWYFQSLTGLKDAWAAPIDKPYIGKDKKLEIECLESIDLRITAMMDLYRKACYDWKNRRCVVPDNLMRFRVSVYVYEARVIGNPNAIALTPPDETPAYGYGGNLRGEASKTNAALVSRLIGVDETRNDPITPNVNGVLGTPMSTTRNLFHFDYCKFDMNQSAHLDTVSNMEPSEVKQKLTIGYEDFEEENMYNFWTATDPVTSAYVRTLDRIALDDPQLEDPGVPLRSTDRPAAQSEQTAKNPSGNSTDIEAEGTFQKEKLAGEKILTLRAVIEETEEKTFSGKIDSIYQSVSSNVENKTGRISDNTLISDTANAVVDGAVGRVTNFVNAKLTGLFLGNVYGLSPGTLLGAGGAQRTANSILDAGASIVNGSGVAQAGADIFDPSNSNGANNTPDGANLGNQYE